MATNTPKSKRGKSRRKANDDASTSAEAPATSPPNRGDRSGEDDRHHMIAEAAYYRAECRGFAPGCELEDWLAAEAELGDGPDESS